MGMFGAKLQYTPDILERMNAGGGVAQMAAPDPGFHAAPQPAFGEPSKGQRIAGIIADTLAGFNGQQGKYAQAEAARSNQMRQFQMQRQAEEQRRAAEMQQFVAQREYDAVNPRAAAPTEFERTVLAAGYVPGSPEYVKLLRQRAENQANPVQGIPGVDENGNQILRFVRPGVGAGQSGGGGQTSVGGRPAIGTIMDTLPGGGAGSQAPRPFR